VIASRIQLPDQPAIAGLVVRPFDPGRDHGALADLIGEANKADGTDWIPTAEELRADFAHTPEFDARRDVLLAEVNGELVGAAETAVRTRDGIGVHEMDGWVRPDWRRRGLGRALLHWTERRAAEVARVDGRTGPRALSAWPDVEQVGALALYEAEGYQVVRHGFLMLRDLGDPIPDLPLPDGLEVRPVRPADHRAIWDAEVEAFRDHWDAAERTDADFENRLAGPDLDTRRWQVAWDGDEVAGSVITYVHDEENVALGISRGVLERISVRRPWRRRGLASALIARSLRDLRTLGLAEAALGVDAENVSGALRVYEAIGFRRARTAANYRKAFTVD
jgi:mycothiol synthase